MKKFINTTKLNKFILSNPITKIFTNIFNYKTIIGIGLYFSYHDYHDYYNCNKIYTQTNNKIKN